MTPLEEAELLENVQKLKVRVTDLEAERDRIKVSEETRLANRRVRYQEDGQWARHYSTVRMTVTTFLVGLSVTVISFGWNYWDAEPRASSVQTAAVLWLVAVGLFTVFTRLTLNMGERATEHRKELTIDNSAPRSSFSRNDPASWAVVLISIGFARFVWWSLGIYWAAGFLGALALLVIVAFLLTPKKNKTVKQAKKPPTS